MSIVIDHEPAEFSFVPRSDCMDYHLDPRTYITSSCLAATRTISIDDGNTHANFIEFTIKGHVFSVYVTPNYTSTTCKWDTDSEIVAANMRDMLMSNINFYPYISITITAQTGYTDLAITWLNCEEQDDWTWDFSNLTGVTSSGNNGLDVAVEETYKVIYQLLSSTGEEVTKLRSVTPILDEDNGQLDTIIKFKKEIQELPQTTLPEFSQTIHVVDSTIIHEVYLKYGWRTLDANCDPVYNTFEDTYTVKVIDSVFQLDDPSGINNRLYGFGITSDIYPLNARPTTWKVCTDSYEWLWFILNANDHISGVTYEVDYIYYNAAGGIISTQTIPASLTDNVYMIPSGTANAYNFESAAAYYTIRVYKVISAVRSTYSVLMTYNIESCCGGDKTEVYFKSGAGGYDTMVFKKLDEINLIHNSQEIFTDIACNSTIESRLESDGKQIINTVGYERLTLEKTIEHSENGRNLAIEFKMSESHFMRVTDTEGDEQQRKLIIEPGGIKIYKEGEVTKLRVTAHYHTDREV